MGTLGTAEHNVTGRACGPASFRAMKLAAIRYDYSSCGSCAVRAASVQGPPGESIGKTPVKRAPQRGRMLKAWPSPRTIRYAAEDGRGISRVTEPAQPI